MAFLADRIFDNGLSVLSTEANALYITSQEPTTYTEAVDTYAVGSSFSVSVSSPQNRSGGGREVLVSSIGDGKVLETAVATHLALVDTLNENLLLVGSISPVQTVTVGSTFNLTSFTIGIPDPA